jgi:hypothetical protein
MRTISIIGWIANATARLGGTRGAVTRRARDAGCSRQTVYNQARKVKAAVEAECGGGKTREALIEQLESLLEENAHLWEWLDQTIEFPPAKQQELAVTATAMGLSSSQIRELMVILLGAKASPSRSTIHRWTQAAATAATRILDQLDRWCRELVLTGCLDEIFFNGCPVLVGVEPHSMVWFLGKKAENHQASTWFTELSPWNSLRYVTSDAGSGLQAGITQLQEHQRATGQVPVEKGLDVFHTKQAAQQALRVAWTRAERAWHQAEAADRALKRARWQGRSERKLTRQRDEAWSKAFAAFKSYEKVEAAWKRVAPALDLFRPDGQLRSRPCCGQRCEPAAQLSA